ncbi:hypothetical protein [Flavobacterium sp.]|uniref:hypothetical protein n=1 Tax=Flavobacterium sp. TaxID=239 RepID=UPI002C08A962|nr:hypothetical protein [Flavobacterium sp.]HSD06218.1 hypothetical protein [Flavobacterium sp.]
MFSKNYSVTGEDVNDYMVMESKAYISYTLRLLYHFLFDKGFSKEKLNILNLGLQEKNQALVCYKDLMFTERFSVELKQCYIDNKISIKSYFLNSKREHCAEVTIEVEWFDNACKEVIMPPKQILQHFNLNVGV